MLLVAELSNKVQMLVLVTGCLLTLGSIGRPPKSRNPLFYTAFFVALVLSFISP
jgi:hypothetical protein